MVCSDTHFPQSHSLLWELTCTAVRSFRDCRWVSGPPWISMGCKRASCLHGLHHVLQRNLCSGTQSTSSSFFTGLDVCRAASLTGSYSPLHLHSHLTPLLFLNLWFQWCYQHHWLTWPWPGAWSVLEPPGVGSVWHRGSSWQLICSPATKTMQCKLNIQLSKHLQIWKCAMMNSLGYDTFLQA